MEREAIARAFAGFLKERDESITPDEADDAERLESGRALAAPLPSPVEQELVKALEADKAVLVAALSNAVAAIQRLHTDVEALIADSYGVYGLHENGDISPWEELAEGGQFEDWIGTPLWSARNAWHDGMEALTAVQSSPNVLENQEDAS